VFLVSRFSSLVSRLSCSSLPVIHCLTAHLLHGSSVRFRLVHPPSPISWTPLPTDQYLLGISSNQVRTEAPNSPAAQSAGDGGSGGWPSRARQGGETQTKSNADCARTSSWSRGIIAFDCDLESSDLDLDFVVEHGAANARLFAAIPAMR
jgi:hypothetical protein